MSPTVMLDCIAQPVNLLSWPKVAEWIIQGSFLVISLLGSAWLAYRYALARLRRETPLLIEREKYNRTLNSLQECWKLLAYMTDTENEKSILVYEQPKGSTQKTWYFRRPQAEEFMRKLPEYFYLNGEGLYLPLGLREPLFKYRRLLFGLLLNDKNKAQEKFLIENPLLIDEMVTLYQNLIKLLRKEAKLEHPQLPENGL